MKTNYLGLLAGAFLSMLSIVCVTASVSQYNTVTVQAPFPMDSIRTFIYPEKDFSITNYGAVAGEESKNTEAIAKAIDACHQSGGGRVIVPAGVWLTGPIHFKSNVNLHLEEGAVLRFTDDPKDYLPAVMTSWEGMECYNYSPLIYALECENIAITGRGILRPVMNHWKKWFPRPKPHLEALKQLYTMTATNVPVEERQMAKEANNLRPHLIHFNRCKTVLLDGFRIEESPFWTIHLYLCDGGIARNLRVKGHGHNTDGIDLEMTRNFLVEDCSFDQWDDAVVIKAGRNQDGWRLNTPSENIVIRNCTILAGQSLLGIGSEISGGIRNVYMHDCLAPNTIHRLFFIKTNHRRGAFVENIYMENIKSGATLRVFEIDMDVLYQWRTLVPTYEERITRISGIHMSNIQCQSSKMIYEIRGDEKLPIKDVTIENLHVDCIADSIRPAVNVENMVIKNITYDKIDPTILPELNRYLRNK